MLSLSPTHSLTVTMNSASAQAAQRLYLRTATPTEGIHILWDAVVGLNAGAVVLVKDCLSLRSNPSTRKTWAQLSAAVLCRAGKKPKWLGVFADGVMAIFRVKRKMCCPQQDVPGQLNVHGHGRRVQRQLSKSAVVSSWRVDISKAALEAQKEI